MPPTDPLAMLSAEEAQRFAGFCERWLGVANSTRDGEREEVELAVQGLYLLAGFEPPAILWCQSPWETVVMPSFVEAVLKTKNEALLNAYIRSGMAKSIGPKSSKFWKALMPSLQAQLKDLFEIPDKQHSLKPGRVPLGAHLNLIFEDRRSLLRAAVRSEFAHRGKAQLCEALYSTLTGKMSKVWSPYKQFIGKYLSGKCASIALELYSHLDGATRTSLCNALPDRLDLDNKHADALKRAFQIQLESHVKASNWQVKIPSLVLTYGFARDCWPDWNWDATSVWELQLWLRMFTVYGWSFYENAVFICERPVEIIRQSPDIAPQKLVWGGGFSVQGAKDSATAQTAGATTAAAGTKAAGKLMKPAEIKDHLDRYVVGQTEAKRTLAVALHNHLKRINHKSSESETEWQKSNVILIGPTGTGKTYLVETLAKLVEVPMIIGDATSLTQTGFGGEKVDNLVKKLYLAADNDVEKTERGIIYIDEIDKLKVAKTAGRDFAGRGAQECLLKVIEAAEVSFVVDFVRVKINTKNILFVCGGAFTGIKKGWRVSRSRQVGIDDLIEFGLIPEFVARLPLIATLDPISVEEMCRILTEPKNAILKQYKEVLAMDDCQLEFEDDAIRAIAEQAEKLGTGARALRSIVDRLMLDIMYNAPSNSGGSQVTITRQMVEAASPASSVSSAKAVTFSDVAGNDGAKADLRDVVRFLRNPEFWGKLKADMPKGILLTGDPGNGKTLLAKALAGESGAEFLRASGSDFVEIWVGQGAQHVREFFSKARAKTPCVMFIDEIDALAGRRSEGPTSGGSKEYDQTVNALLVELDGFDKSEGIVLVAATNRPDMLDPALLRPGRIDRQLAVELPTREARKQIFALNLGERELAPGLEREWLLEQLADRTAGQSGAFCAAIIEEAALLSLRRAFDQADRLLSEGLAEDEAASQLNRAVTLADFDEALDKVWFGSVNEASEAARSEEDRYKTAVHEVGHALTATLTKDYPQRITKVTIVARANHLGYMASVPIKDRQVSFTKEELEARIRVSLGGRAATELVLGVVDTGPKSDFESAWSVARQYVVSYGMSDLGIIATRGKEHPSTQLAGQIDKEVRSVVDRLMKETCALLSPNIPLIERLARKLVEQETILADEWYSQVEKESALRL